MAAKLNPSILFFGSDSFSSTILTQLHRANGLWSKLYLVVPPISRSGRNLKTIYRPPLLQLADQLNLPCHVLSKPSNPKENPLRNWSLSKEFKLDTDDLRRREGGGGGSMLITASFPYKIPSEMINLFEPSRALNVHPSLLPLCRGPAPIQWQIADQRHSSGVTIQDLSTKGFDRGRILAQNHTPLPHNVTYSQAENLLARLAADTLCSVISDLDHFIDKATPQDESKATHAPKITQLDLRISPTMSVSQVHARYRAMSHHYPLSIQVNSDVYYVIPLLEENQESHQEEIKKWKKDLLLQQQQPQENKSGEIKFNRHLNLVSIRLNNPSTPVQDGQEVLIINKFKLAAAGGKGWIEPTQWWDRLTNRFRQVSSSTTTRQKFRVFLHQST